MSSSSESNSLTLLADRYLDALLNGRRQVAYRLVMDSVAEGVGLRDIYLGVFQASQYEIGRLWQKNEITIAQEHYCTAATQMIMAQLYPHIFSSRKRIGTFVSTCVSGDLHEIGARMVADFLEMEGWDTYYLGANTPIAAVVQAVIENKADLLGISVTIMEHLSRVRELIDAIHSTPQAANVKIIVGGRPFNLNPRLWEEVKADGFAQDAEEALFLARGFLRPQN